MTNSITTLAATKIGTERIAVELTESPGAPATVSITWPRRSVSMSERHVPDLAATLTRLFANASTELAFRRPTPEGYLPQASPLPGIGCRGARA